MPCCTCEQARFACMAPCEGSTLSPLSVTQSLRTKQLLSSTKVVVSQDLCKFCFCWTCILWICVSRWEAHSITDYFGKCSPKFLFISSHYPLNKDNHTSHRDLKRAPMTFNENTMEVERTCFKSFRKTALAIC